MASAEGHDFDARKDYADQYAVFSQEDCGYYEKTARRLYDETDCALFGNFFLGGVGITFIFNVLYFTNLTDEPTCYKTFRADVIKKIRIKGNRFEWEPEVTAKIVKKGIKIHEVPIKYYPRSTEEGKKINWKDGVEAVWTMFKYRFIN